MREYKKSLLGLGVAWLVNLIATAFTIAVAIKSSGCQDWTSQGADILIALAVAKGLLLWELSLEWGVRLWLKYGKDAAKVDEKNEKKKLKRKEAKQAKKAKKQRRGSDVELGNLAAESAVLNRPQQQRPEPERPEPKRPEASSTQVDRDDTPRRRRNLTKSA